MYREDYPMMMNEHDERILFPLLALGTAAAIPGGFGGYGFGYGRPRWGYGFGRPGWGYGRPGFGYGRPGWGYGFGRPGWGYGRPGFGWR